EFSSTVQSLMWDGTGLVAGGTFTSIGGVPAPHIARWDGQAWRAMGDGLNGMVSSITMRQGAILAGGTFTMSGAHPVVGAARWDGAAWQPLATPGVALNALLDFNGTLYAAGLFGSA